MRITSSIAVLVISCWGMIGLPVSSVANEGTQPKTSTTVQKKKTTPATKNPETAPKTKKKNAKKKRQRQKFSTFVASVKKQARRQGIKKKTLERAFKGVKPIKRVIELDRKQPEFSLSFAEYQQIVAPKSRVKKGRKLLKKHFKKLTHIGKKYNVQPRFIVALWGIETGFGHNTGGFPVIASLATLAYDGRRSAYFRKELLNALKILDQGHIAHKDMQGSWAGAMGQSQFMPSSFLAYAVDHNGDGRRDIWTTKDDVFASAANYLASNGWKGNQTWGRAVKLPKKFNRKLAGLKVRKSVAAWQKLGVRRLNGTDLPKTNRKAAIILPDKGARKPAYLVYQNFYNIRKWNPSNYFALGVGILSDAIASN